jgi:hypothetical protein
VVKKKYVAKAEAGKGWRVWNRKTKKWWGNYFAEYPEELLDELNGDRDTKKIVELSKKSFVK